jgi:preprotein translocase subunit Sec63
LFALLFTLELSGCVDLREQPEPVVEGARDGVQVDAERILERLRLAREADYFELLGVARDASRSEIRQAHTELGATFSDDALEESSRRRHARELRELRAALEEARDILIDDAMRSAYLAHLGDSST